MNSNPLLRRALGGVALTTCVALAATGCSSSSNGNPIGGGASSVVGGASSVASSAVSSADSASSAPVTSDSSSTSAAPSPTTSSASSAGGGGAAAAFCTDLNTLVTISGKIAAVVGTAGNPSKADFPKLKGLYNDLGKLGKKLESDAPSSVAASAKDYDQSINALNVAVQTSSTAAQVQSKVLANASLKAATGKLTSSSTALVNYKTKSC